MKFSWKDELILTNSLCGLTSCEATSPTLASICHVRVAMVAVTAPADISIGAICGVEAHAVLAAASKIWPLSGLFAREPAQRPGCDCRDKKWAHVRVRWEVNEVLLQAVDVRPVTPPFLLHHVHARIERRFGGSSAGDGAIRHLPAPSSEESSIRQDRRPTGMDG
jgi:hypothetical protein